MKLYNDANEPEPGRSGGRLQRPREQDLHLQGQGHGQLAAGGAVNVFRPRSTQEGQGRAWYPVWNSGSGYALGLQAGAELTLMENRFVPARFKDGYGPVGAWFLFFKAKATNSPRRGLLRQRRSTWPKPRRSTASMSTTSALPSATT